MLREVEVEVGRGKTVANGGQEDRCDGADVLVKRRSSTVVSGKDVGQAAKISRRRIADSSDCWPTPNSTLAFREAASDLTQGKRSQLLEPVHCGNA